MELSFIANKYEACTEELMIYESYLDIKYSNMKMQHFVIDGDEKFKQGDNYIEI